jgi:hypothetical protein
VQSWLVAVVVVMAAVVAVLGVIRSLRRGLPGGLELTAGIACAAVVLLQSVVAGVAMIRGTRPVEQATTIGYLLGIALVMPLGLAWAYAERSRTGGYVLAVAAFTVAVMTARLVMLWRGAGV